MMPIRMRKKKLLFDAVTAGRIRFLLGSTEKMGAGTNVQKKLIAEHDLDAPWRPRDSSREMAVSSARAMKTSRCRFTLCHRRQFRRLYVADA